MTKKIADIVTESRSILNDLDTPYRYTDDALIDIVNRAFQEVYRVRPDVYFDTFDDTNVVVPEYTTATAATSDFPIDYMFFGPIVNYTVATAELLDDEFTADSRAALLLARFSQQLISAA